MVFANTLFIPAFFLVTGFLINPVVFYHSLIDNFALAVSIVMALLIGNFVAAEISAVSSSTLRRHA